VLIALAVAAIVQAATFSDVAPVRAQPLVGSITRPAVAALRGRTTAPAPVSSEIVPPGRQSVRVPILMYHYIRVNPDPRDKVGFNLSVTPADFTQQMDWLAQHGYHPVDFDDLRGYLMGHANLPSRPVVLTFDDGYRDMYTTAFPVLRAHGFKAVSYVVSGFVGSPSSVTVDQVQQMNANGIEIGAHTVSHADLTRISPAERHREVFDSKASLEALLGHPVLDFCYPSGRVDDAVVREVEAAGFETATTTQPGVLHSAGDRFTWTRVRVGGGEPLDQFVANLGQSEPTEVVQQPRPRLTPDRGGLRQLPVTFPLRPPPAALAEAPATTELIP